MAFFIKNFTRVLKKSNFRNIGKNKKYESRRRSNRPCFGCNKVGHFIADCPEEKIKNKDNNESSSKKDKSRYKKKGGEAHLGQKWDSNEEVNPKRKMLQQWHSRHHLLIPQDYLKISPTMRIKIPSCVSWPKISR